MTLPPPPGESDAIKESRAKAERLAAAFAEVFCAGSRRTASQRLVLDHLGKCAGDEGNSYKFGDSGDGISKIAAGIHRDGARSILRVIDFQIDKHSKLKQPKAAKPQTIK